MITPNPRGFASESPLYRLRYALRDRQSHWSFDEKLRTRAKAPRVIRTDADVQKDALVQAMQLLHALGASK